MKYEKFKVCGQPLSLICEPPDQSQNVMNFLMTGDPLKGHSLDGVIVEFMDGDHIGKKGIFVTELYVINDPDEGVGTMYIVARTYAEAVAFARLRNHPSSRVSVVDTKEILMGLKEGTKLSILSTAMDRSDIAEILTESRLRRLDVEFVMDGDSILK